MKKLPIYSLFIVLTLIYGCTKKATIDLPDSRAKVVVTCFISPDDSVIAAVVRLSVPKFGAQDSSASLADDIKDAVVKISDGQTEATLPFDNNFNFYQLSTKSFPVTPGGTYKLEVTTKDGTTVNATTTVPEEKLTIESFETPIITNDSTTLEYDIKLVVPDVPGKTTYVAYFFQNTTVRSGTVNPNMPIFFDLSSWSEYESDENSPKTKFFHTSSSFASGTDTIRKLSLKVGVLNCSREFYLYNKSVNEVRFGSNPFADPVMVYSNVNNGLGCFGAYRSTTTFTNIR